VPEQKDHHKRNPPLQHINISAFIKVYAAWPNKVFHKYLNLITGRHLGAAASGSGILGISFGKIATGKVGLLMVQLPAIKANNNEITDHFKEALSRF
jgi:hypothetical protein